MILEYLAGPAVGGVIGYITNDLAIRMLFKPHEAKRVCGVYVPFTPGIIPKEKNRLASAIGKAVSEHLMNPAVLERTLLSAEMMEKLGNAFDSFVATQRDNSETLEAFAGHYLSERDVAAIRDNVSAEVVAVMTEKLRDSSVGEAIARMATAHVVEKTRRSVAGRIGADRLVELLAVPVEKALARHIGEVLQAGAPQMVEQLVSSGSERLLEQPMCELVRSHEAQVAQLRDGLLNAYRNLIEHQLPHILAAVDISHIVEQRICEMDMDEAEGIILSVMHRELRAIVWLGALLGCLMGTITSLIH